MPTQDYFANLVAEVNQSTEASSQMATSSLSENSFINSNQQQLLDWEAEEQAKSIQQGFGESILNRVTKATVQDAFGSALKAIPRGLAASAESNIPEEARAAYQREKEGKATPEDIALLDSTNSEFGQSLRGQLDFVESMKGTAEKIDKATNLEQLVDTTRTDNLNEDLMRTGKEVQAKWEMGKAKIEVGDTIGGVMDVVDAGTTAIWDAGVSALTNPQAVIEHLAEEIPELVVIAAGGGLGKAVGAAATIGETLDVRQESIEALETKLGRTLTDDEMSNVNKLATGYFATDYLADLVGADKLGKGLVGTKKAVKDLVVNTISEGSSEAIQTVLEKKMVGEEASVAELYPSAATGGLVGSALSGTKDAPTIALEAAKKGVEVSKDVAKDIEKTSAMAQLETGKTYLDESKLPTKTEKMGDRIKRTIETNSPELATETIQAAKDPREAVAVAKDITNADVTPEVKQRAVAEVDRIIAVEEAKAADLQAKSMDAMINGDFDEGDRLGAEATAALKKAQSLNTTAKGIIEAATLTKEDLTKELDNVLNGDTEATKRIFGSFKANPDSISDEQLQTLSTAEAVPEVERKQYQAVAEVRKLMNTLQGTEKEILEGGYNKEYDRDMLGLKDYQHMIMSGNAEAGIKGLTKFAELHTGKAEQFEAALEESKSTGKQVNFNYGGRDYYINAKAPKSASLVTSMRKEADVLTNAVAAYNTVPWDLEGTTLTEPTDTVETVTPEAVVSETPSDVEAETSSAPVEAVTSTPESVAPVSTESTQPTKVRHEKMDVKAGMVEGMTAAVSSLETTFQKEMDDIDYSVKQGELTAEEAKLEKESADYVAMRNNINKVNTLLEAVPTSTSLAEAMQKTNTSIEDIKAVANEDTLDTETREVFDGWLEQFEDSQIDYGQLDIFEEPTVTEEVDEAPFDDESIAEAQNNFSSKVVNKVEDVREKVTTFLRNKLTERGDVDGTQVVDRVLDKLPEDIVIVNYNGDPNSVTPEQLATINKYPNAQGIQDGNTIYVMPSSKDKVETLLHELDHVVITKALRTAKEAPLGSKERLAYANLDSLFNALVKRLNTDPDFKRKAEAVYLDKILTEYPAGTSKDVKLNELMTWGRTNPNVRNLLKETKLGGTNVWDKIVAWFSDILGITPDQFNAYLQLTTTADIIVGNSILPVETQTALAANRERVATVEQIEDYSLAEQLTAIKDAEDVPLTERNLVADWFEKGSKKTTLETKNDFFQRLSEDPVGTLEDIYGEGEVTEDMYETADNFIKFHEKFIGSFDAIFKNRDSYKFDDFIQYTLDSSGNVPVNIKTAMAVSAYDWVMSSAYDTNFVTESSVRSILGLSDTDYLAPEAYKLIGKGRTTASIKASLSTGVRPLLSLKLKGEANAEADKKLNASMGTWAFYSLVHADLLNVSPAISTKPIKELYDANAQAEGDVIPDGITNLGDKLELAFATNYKDTLDGSKKSSFTSDVFGSEREKPMPSFKPTSATKSITKSSQKTTYRQRQLLKKEQERAAKINKSVATTFFNFNEELQKDMLGFEADIDSVIDAKKGGVEGKNRQIEKDLQITKDWIAELNSQPTGLDTLFYYTHTVWRQGRMGIANMFNPQASKIMRYFQHKASWETEVTFGSPSEDWFLLAVGEGFDIVSDKNSDADSLDAVKEKLKNPVIRQGIDAMKAILNKDNSEANQRAVVEAVKAGEMGMKTYQVLNAYAAYENAKDKNQATFNHSLAREVDGITNGVFITTLQFAQANMSKLFAMMNRMGVFGKFGSKLNDFVAFNKVGQDSYRTLAKKWNQANQQWLRKNPDKVKAFNALQDIFGKMVDEQGEVTSTGRTLAKNPLMTFIYGASYGTILGNMANNGIGNIYDKLQDAYTNGDLETANTELAKFGAVIGKSIRVNNLQQLKEFTFNKYDIKKFNSEVRGMYRQGLESALKSEYGTTIEARDKFTAAVNLAHAIYAEHYNARKEEILATKKDIIGQLRQLTVDEQKALLEELKPFSPVINTAITALSKDRKKDKQTVMEESGLVLGGTELAPRKNAKGGFTIDTEVKLKFGSKVGGKTTGSSHYLVDVLKAPGASAIPMLTQSIDAATQLFFMDYVDGLNVHDAEYMGEKDFGLMVQKYNEIHLNIHKKFTMALEYSKMFNRIVNNARPSRKIWGRVKKTPEYANALDKIGDTDEKGMSEKLTALAVGFDANKKKAISNMSTFAQYRNGDDSALDVTKKVEVSPQLAAKGVVQEVQQQTNPTPSPNGALFSSTYEGEFESFEFEPATEINSMNTLETFEHLRDNSVIKDSTEHSAYLEKTITEVINNVIEPFNLHFGSSDTTVTKGMTDGSDMYIINQIHGVNTPSGILASMSNMSGAEVFVHEMVHNITQQAIGKNPFIREQLDKLWNQAKKSVRWEHFLPEGISRDDASYETEKKIAKDKWNHIFLVRKDAVVNGKAVSNHLHEFMAMGVTNEKFRNELAKIPYTAIKRKRGKGLLGALEYAWELTMDTLNKWIGDTRTGSADAQLDNLFRSIANVDSKTKAKILKTFQRVTEKPTKIGNRLVDIGSGISDDLKAKAKKSYANSGAKRATKAIKKDYDTQMDKFKSMMINSNNIVAEGMVNIANEASGRTANNGKHHDVRRKGQKVIDATRENIRLATANAMRSVFKTEPTAEQERAMLFGLAKTDAATLKDQLGLEGLREVFRNPDYLNRTIANYERLLRKYSEAAFYATQADNLGFFMVTGESKLAKGLLNAKAISNLAGTGNKAQNPQEVEPIIDVLASLRAVQYLNAQDKRVMNELFANELKGISFSLDILNDFNRKSQEEFKDNPYSLLKGYVRDMVDPDIAIAIGSNEDKATMAKKGFTQGELLSKDDTDPSTKDRFIYVNPYGSQASYLRGNFYLQTKTAKGTNVTGVAVNMDTEIEPVEFDADMFAAKDRKADKEYTGRVNKNARSNTVPVIDSEGNISGYRYIMSEASKDHYLKRDASFFNTVGVMQGDLVAKQAIPNQNKQVVDAIYEQYDKDFHLRSDQYVAITHKSLDPEIREIYAMLPREAKEYIKTKFKGPMYVRKDMINLLFGYRKVRLGDSFFKDPEMMNALEAALVPALNKVFGSNVGRRIMYAQDALEEMTKFTKDLIVVKSGIVTLGNTISNVVQLWLSGVPAAYVAKHYAQSFEALRQYKKVDTRRSQVEQLLLDTSLAVHQRARLENEMLQLETALAENPIGELIDEGVLPNIVEDMGARPDDFSIKSKALKRLGNFKAVDQFTKRIPETAKMLTREFLLTQDSEMYQLLNGAAQFSDFGARAVRFKYLTEQQGMDKQVALGKVMDEFINYDLPTGRYLQFMNDIGILWFSKYLVRVQKQIFSLMLNNPARVLSVLAASNLLNVPTGILGSVATTGAIASRLGDPISATMGAVGDFTPFGVFT